MFVHEDHRWLMALEHCSTISLPVSDDCGSSLHVKTFDKLAAATFCLSVGFSVGVGLASWRWFPIEGDWGHIADIPPNYLSDTALLLPWVVALFYFLVRRFVFRQRFAD